MGSRKGSIEFIKGCLIGGAAGDALGAPVEFMPYKEITRQFGEKGITAYAPVYGRKGAITDDTQMTLFTAEGLILSKVRDKKHNIESMTGFVYQAYLRWLTTQRQVNPDLLIKKHGTCAVIDGLLITRDELYSRRAPGNSCLSALLSGKQGTCHDPVNNSKGCGGVMRIAPAGLFAEPDLAFDLGCSLAAITHGHPTGYLAAGCLARIISEIYRGSGLLDAVEKSLKILKTKPRHEECLKAINAAMRAVSHEPVSHKTVERLGEGWIAEEALAIGLYCAMVAGGDFEKGICLAVNHGGDSDSTGSIAGQIMGVMYGIKAIPEKYIKELELADIIGEISIDLFENVL